MLCIFSKQNSLCKCTIRNAHIKNSVHETYAWRSNFTRLAVCTFWNSIFVFDWWTLFNKRQLNTPANALDRHKYLRKQIYLIRRFWIKLSGAERDDTNKCICILKDELKIGSIRTRAIYSSHNWKKNSVKPLRHASAATIFAFIFCKRILFSKFGLSTWMHLNWRHLLLFNRLFCPLFQMSLDCHSSILFECIWSEFLFTAWAKRVNISLRIFSIGYWTDWAWM